MISGVSRFGPGVWFFPAYGLVTMLIGWKSRRRFATAGDYLNASHTLPLPIVIIAYLASNCGALEIVGLSAMAAHYGALAFHFYLIGAIPGMIFLALWMMPVYLHNGITSVPEYLMVRYGPRMRLLNACVTACIMLLLSGISLYAMAQVLTVTVGITFEWGILCCASIVIVYVFLGGIRATIYNELFQFFVIVAGLLPLALRSFHFLHLHGQSDAPQNLHLWHGMQAFAPQARMDGFGVVAGLGFVLGFGYWCTDFVMMQRAFAARTENDARQVPLWAGFGKLLFSLLVVVPGLAAMHVLPQTSEHYDRTLPRMMTVLYSPWLQGLGLTALAASLMSSLASNVSAFAALWTEDIYRTTLCKNRDDRHYLRMGHFAVLAAMLLSLSASYLNFLFRDLMEHIQLIFSVFAAPFWAVFLLGMLTRRTSERGAIFGFLLGSSFSFAHSVAVSREWLHYGSTMNANFHSAMYAFTIAAVAAWLLSPRAHVATAGRLQWSIVTISRTNVYLTLLALLLLIACVWFNVWWF